MASRVKDSALTILVLGVAGNVSQGILKALHHSSLPTRVLGADITPLGMGLYTVDKAFVSPTASESGFQDWLYRLCQDEKVDVVLSGVEPILDALAVVREDLQRQTGTVCIVSSPDQLEIGRDKLKTCAWLVEKGFEAPICALHDDEAAMAQLLQRASFPLLAKPRFGKGSEGIVRIVNEEELNLLKRRKDYVVQEYLGSPDQEFTAGAFVDRPGNVRGAIVMRRDLLSGTTYRAEIGQFPEVRDIAVRIAGLLKPMGPCNIQLRQTERGPVVFEINVRFSGSTPMREHFGYHEVEAAIRHFVLNEPIADLPLIADGVSLRYWNEIYVSSGAVTSLRTTGRLSNPRAFPLKVEDYGMTR